MPLKFTLKETMKKHRITQKELSAASGVRPNTIADLRSGDAKKSTVEKLTALMDALSRMTGETCGLDAIMIYVEEDSE